MLVGERPSVAATPLVKLVTMLGDFAEQNSIERMIVDERTVEFETRSLSPIGDVCRPC